MSDWLFVPVIPLSTAATLAAAPLLAPSGASEPWARPTPSVDGVTGPGEPTDPAP